VSQPGLAFDPATPLVDRALDRIRTGPVDTGELAREVFDLTHAPEGLAARLVYELLGTDQRVCVDSEGTWRIAVSGPDESGAATLLADLEFAVVDVETTGSRGEDRVMEIACVHVAGGSITGRYSTLVNPGCWIPERISRLTGIDEPMVRAAPRFDEVAEVIRRALSGRVFVAHNARFDWRFVSSEMMRARAEAVSGDQLCTVRFAKRALPGLRRWGLDSLISYYGLECRARHRAWGDALVTAEVLLHLLEAADRRGVTRWDQLQRWLGRQPAGRSEDAVH
jgi:DNA polymerase III epsilon subunit family exonuclease